LSFQKVQLVTHGFCWYKSEFKGTLIDYGMAYGGQFIILIPNKKLTIVTTHNHNTPKGIEQQMKFLNGKLPGLIEKYGYWHRKRLLTTQPNQSLYLFLPKIS
jgi:hypothetical protein